MVDENQLKEILSKAFPGILESEINELIQSGRVQYFEPGCVLCQEGALESTFYVILEGNVEVTKSINQSEERFLTNLSAGDFFGEMAIIHNAPRAATITTLTKTKVLEIPREGFASMLERSSSMSMAIVREISRRLRENDEMAIEDFRQKAGQLAEAYQQLAEQDYARRIFLTTIAHELRTPLMAANGYLHLIRSGALQGEALKSALDTIGRNLLEITSLTNDILFLQEMELILPEFELTDVGAVAHEAVKSLQERATQNNVKLHINIQPDLPRIQADAKSLGRAISAILDNAIKFSPDGGDVHLTIGSDQSQVWIIIQDHGVGIPSQYLPRIFERFFHLDEVNGRMFRGAGLGLSIARQVIEQHKGRITVDSEVGQGSTFIVRLRR
ncbi:MAG: cyclic nucleotide-binding domain-containing protein [Longilinea sp.]|nr:cyclic nucleotide-binding domain-containing protein [Longilinea sp.]MCA1954112.1 cyclic nucleotide-binding domain-containing protein [Anaerolinea sp.]